MKTFSFRAECGLDVGNFLVELPSTAGRVLKIDLKMRPINDLSPDVTVEISVNAELSELLRAAELMDDGHVIFDTLKEKPLAENDLRRW